MSELSPPPPIPLFLYSSIYIYRQLQNSKHTATPKMNIYLHFILTLFLISAAHGNTEAGFFHTNSIESIQLNDSITRLSEESIRKDRVLSLSIPNIELDQFKEFYIPINQTDLNGFYNIRISWDALSPIDIYKFDVVQANNNVEDDQITFVYLKYKYDCYPLTVFEDYLNFKILLSSTVLGFIPRDLVPVVKLISATAVAGLLLGHLVYRFLVSI